ncbi:glycosyltransferase [Pseudomonas fulva]|uniref:Glycosyltransferase n=1 Tax=Pseudomonas fulva TaxID=47880 RepID=A0A7S9LAQ3_9PSED|nr:glycosyltransferase [Pseudomonas fulva]MBA1220962.1 glycosyltransferase [Pseudomonas fulva]MBN4166932.1 glycosyltransferase [Pseudomonas fulva]QPH45281.1 glycosyltransferase [Pseudomonas fulva]QPH50358.1 glycosyltransferase [Pseudomonas fulva]
MTDHLPNQSQTAPLVMQPEFSGAILGLQGDVLHGWAMDNAQPEHRPIVEVLIDGASVALVRAEQYEPNAPVGDLFHGFAVQLRPRWLDGARLITARIANQSFILQGQVALPATPSDDSAAVSSQVWHTGGLRIGGWCWDPKAPNRHVEVTVRNGDQIVGRALCNQHSQALAYRASSDHGFVIDLPWSLADGKVYELEIVNDLGRPLAGSPIRLCCWPEGVEGLIRRLDQAQDATTLALLNDVAKEQSIRLPKSAGWDSYPKWFETFQRLDAVDTSPLVGTPGVLLISEGEAALEQRTLSSLENCYGVPHALAYAPMTNLGPALEKLIASGCDRILPIHAGDRLANFALGHLSALLEDGSSWAYADCDRDGPENERTSPWLKPVWDIDLFIGADIFTPGAIFSVSIIQEALILLGERSAPYTCNWHQLIAAIALATQRNASSVTHLPRVLYHRAHKTAASPERAQRCTTREHAIAWLCEHLAEGATISVIPEYPSLLRAHWPLPSQLPRVSLVVPTRDQFKLLYACIEGLLNKTDYPDLEVIVVDNQSTDPQTLDYLSTLDARGVTVLRHPFPFNYSTINNRAVDLASGEIVGLVNNDIEIIDGNWLKEMVAQLLRPGVGAVGAKLLWPNHMVQHGGVVVGINGLAAHSGNTLAAQDPGYMALNQLTRRQSAVTAACMLMRKSVFHEANGLDECLFPVAFNDVDLCLRIQRQGFHLVWAASAQLIHAESASRGKDVAPEKRARAQREQQKFIERWTFGNYTDPFYHPALAKDYLTGPYGGLAMPLYDYAQRQYPSPNSQRREKKDL